MRFDRRAAQRIRCCAAGLRALTAGLLGGAALLTGCSTAGGGGAAAGKDAPTRPDYGQIASMRAIGGSAVSGKIRVIDRGDGATMLVSVLNLPYGPFRIALNETPNCTSPNGFSAGSPWAPASSAKPPADLIPIQYSNPEKSRVEIEARISGLHATGANGVAGHSVVIYAGTRVTEAQPDVRNERIACGVFEPATLFSF